MVFTAAEHSRTCCLGVNNIQTRSKRLGPGLTASAPHHRPRGLLHPLGRKRLDFVSADNQWFGFCGLDFWAAQGACAFARAACMPRHARSLSTPALLGLVQAWFSIMEVGSADGEAARRRNAPRANAATVDSTTTHMEVGVRGVEISSSRFCPEWVVSG